MIYKHFKNNNYEKANFRFNYPSTNIHKYYKCTNLKRKAPLTKKIPQLQPIFLTAEALAKEDGNSFGDFQAIICGKTVEDLTDKEMMKGFIEKAEKAHVKIVVCGLSLKKFKVNKEDIPHELEVVDNGLLHNFQLQKKGYLSIEL